MSQKYYVIPAAEATVYIALDCSGSALQFTGTGHSIQCAKDRADKFETEEAAEAALKLAEETGGFVESVEIGRP